MRVEKFEDLVAWQEGIEIALGSAAELETQLIISKKLGFMTNEVLFEWLERVKSKILGLVRHLKGRKNA